MNKHDDSSTPAKGKRIRRWIFAITLVTAAGTVAAVSASPAGNWTGMFGHQRHHARMAMDSPALDEHIRKFIDQALADGTPEQKAAVAAIAKSALADLRPAHEQFYKAHVRAHELLAAPAVDRAALEELRVEQMRQLDAASRRLFAALEDAADVLTPAQRARLGEHLGKHLH